MAGHQYALVKLEKQCFRGVDISSRTGIEHLLISHSFNRQLLNFVLMTWKQLSCHILKCLNIRVENLLASAPFQFCDIKSCVSFLLFSQPLSPRLQLIHCILIVKLYKFLLLGSHSKRKEQYTFRESDVYSLKFLEVKEF